MDNLLFFAGAVFAVVFVLTLTITVPVFGEQRRVQKQLSKRIGQIQEAGGPEAGLSIIREKYLKRLNPMERALESVPLFQGLSLLIEQTGRQIPAYRVVLIALALGALTGGLVWFNLHSPWAALLAAGMALTLPFIKLTRDRQRRIGRFEEALPEALDMLTRSLQAGHPFVDSIRLVSEEFDEPLGKEFALTYAELNYGRDLRAVLLSLLDRVPSITLMALVTSVLIQRETGGNLTEVLKKIAGVIRGRFRFHRRVKTLSAEGRLAAWILSLIPFALFATLWFLRPSYVEQLFQSPQGINLMIAGLAGVFIGILWIRRILRIEV